MPAQVEPYVRALGPDKAVDFLLAYGGAPFYFSRSATSRARATKVIGEDGIAALGKEFGGLHLRVPLAREWIARQLAHKGESVYEIARLTGKSDVTVRKWLQGKKPPLKHPDLFD